MTRDAVVGDLRMWLEASSYPRLPALQRLVPEARSIGEIARALVVRTSD